MKCRIRSLEAKVRTLRAERDAAFSGEVYESMRSDYEKTLDDQKRAYEKKIQELENSTPGRLPPPGKNTHRKSLITNVKSPA